MIKPIFTSGQLSPSRAFNWANGYAVSGVDVSRAGVATFLGSNGLIQSASADTQRVDYSTGSPALLIEESRTNIIYPFIPDAAATGPWANGTGITSVTDNAAIAPDGTMTATAFVGLEGTSNSNAGSSLRWIELAAPAGTYTLSFYAAVAAGTVNASARFVDVGAGLNVTLPALDNNGSDVVTTEFKRFSATVTLGAGSTIFSNIFGFSSNSTTIYLWGAQLEVGEFATSIIPTTAAAPVTRNADVATLLNFSDFWQAGKGSALVRARPYTVSGISPVLQFDDTTADNIIALRGNAANPELYIRNGGVDQAQIDAGTIAANASYRLAGAWATNDCAASLNSGTPVLDGVATIPTVTQARIGSDGTNYLNGHIEAIEYYDERLPSASLQVLSSQAGRNSIIGSVFRDSIIS